MPGLEPLEFKRTLGRVVLCQNKMDRPEKFWNFWSLFGSKSKNRSIGAADSAIPIETDFDIDCRQHFCVFFRWNWTIAMYHVFWWTYLKQNTTNTSTSEIRRTNIHFQANHANSQTFTNTERTNTPTIRIRYRMKKDKINPKMQHFMKTIHKKVII